MKDKIEEQLDLQHKTWHWLAKRLNVEPATLYGIKYGKTKNPRFNLVVKIADELGVPLDYFREESK